MNSDWLWDRRIPIEDVRKIFTDDQHERFVELASLLLSRKNTPKEVFADYLSQEIFIRNWSKIKRRMGQDQWNKQRIIFWQAIYERLLFVLKEKGKIVVQQRRKQMTRDVLCEDIGHKLQRLREQSGLTQGELADQLGISQQIISRIERGRDNISLLYLKKIAKAFHKNIRIQFVQS